MDDIAKQLLSQGVLGGCVLALLYALRVVFKLYVDSQEKRVAESVDNRAAIERNTSAMTALTEVVKASKAGQ